MLVEPLQELQVDLPGRGIRTGQAVVGGTEVGHTTPGTGTRIRRQPTTYGKDLYSLSNNERHATSQLCYSRRMWDLCEALLGEHPMERCWGWTLSSTGGGTTSCRASWRQQQPLVLQKGKTLSRPCHPIPRAGRTWPSGTTKTQKSLLSRDQIAGEGGYKASGAQSAMSPPWFCDKLGAGGDRCRGHRRLIFSKPDI